MFLTLFLNGIFVIYQYINQDVLKRYTVDLFTARLDMKCMDFFLIGTAWKVTAFISSTDVAWCLVRKIIYLTVTVK